MRGFVCALFLIAGMIAIVPEVSFAQAGDAKQVAVAAKINVNTATEKELQRLPDIGKVIAQRIVEYRSTVKPFAVPEDLLKVNGIGKKTLEKIRDQIAFE